MVGWAGADDRVEAGDWVGAGAGCDTAMIRTLRFSARPSFERLSPIGSRDPNPATEIMETESSLDRR